MELDRIKEQVLALLKNGDEKALEKFLVQNFKNLPDEVQGKLLVGWFNDAARKMTLQEKALAALEELDKIEMSLREQLQSN